jgi:hypothetical protein
LVTLLDLVLPVEDGVEGVEVELVLAGVRARKELEREVPVGREERERAKRLEAGVVLPDVEE